MAESSQVQHLLECPICQERFTQPKALSCQHTFCLSCLRGYVKDARHFNCPSCRQRQVVPKAGLKELKDNFLIKNLMDIVHEAPQTATCLDCGEEDQVLHECDHCEEKVCSSCRKKHAKLAVEIFAHFLSMSDKVLTEEESGKSGVFSSSTVEGEDRKLRASVYEAIDQTNAALKERQTEWLTRVESVSRFRTLLAMGRVDAKKGFRAEMKSCSSVEKLMTLKESLTQLSSARAFFKTLVRGSCPVLKFDVSCLRNLGDLYCEDVAFTTSDRGPELPPDQEIGEINRGNPKVHEISLRSSDPHIPSPTDDEESLDENDVHDSSIVKSDLETPQTSPESPLDRRENRVLFPFNLFERFGLARHVIDKRPAESGSVGSDHRNDRPNPTASSTKEQIENRQLFPFKVNYQSKQTDRSTRQIICRHPSPRRVIKPICAVYCDHENAVYCIAKGELLCYDLCTLKGQRISEVKDAKHLTITKSGKVLFTDGEIVKCLKKVGTQWSIRPIVGGFNSVTQLCCQDENILVLDVSDNDGQLTKFSPDGELVCEYGKKCKLNESSRICVDSEGRIYVSSVWITRKDNEDWLGDCGICRVSESVEVSWEVEITTLTPGYWYTSKENMVVEKGSEDYRYDFIGPRYRCPEGKRLSGRRDETSVPDDRAVRENVARGLCVDGDGYVSVTRPDLNQIDVYINKYKHRRNGQFYWLFPVKMRTWTKLIPMMEILIYLFMSFICVHVAGSVAEYVGKVWPGLRCRFEAYIQSHPFLIWDLILYVLLYVVYDYWLGPVKRVATIRDFDEPNSVSLTPDGKMIVCDKKGINVIA